MPRTLPHLIYERDRDNYYNLVRSLGLEQYTLRAGDMTPCFMGISMTQLEHPKLENCFLHLPTYLLVDLDCQQTHDGVGMAGSLQEPPFLTCVFLASVATGRSFSFRLFTLKGNKKLCRAGGFETAVQAAKKQDVT